MNCTRRGFEVFMVIGGEREMMMEVYSLEGFGISREFGFGDGLYAY